MFEEVAGTFELEIVTGIEEGCGIHVSMRVSSASHGDQRDVCPDAQYKGRQGGCVMVSLSVCYRSKLRQCNGFQLEQVKDWD
jgi:hypothetical protein